MDDEFSAESFNKSRAKRMEQEKLKAQAAAEADPELRALQQQTAQAQQETLQSSRSALRQLQDTVAVGDSTGAKLKQQGEQLDRIQQTAERADENAQQSYESARDLRKYKGFIPVSMKNIFHGKKKKEEDKELAKTTRTLDKDAAKRTKQQDMLDKQNLAQQGTGPQGLPKREYADDNEREIDDNLNEMSSGLSVLKQQATEMNRELDRQKLTAKKTEAYVEHTDYTLNSANRKIKEFQ